MPDLPFSSRADHVESLLRVKESFDVIARKILVGGRDAVLFFIDGFVKDEVMEKILEYIMSLKAEEVKDISGAEVFAGRFITYVAVSYTHLISIGNGRGPCAATSTNIWRRPALPISR